MGWSSCTKSLFGIRMWSTTAYRRIRSTWKPLSLTRANIRLLLSRGNSTLYLFPIPVWSNTLCVFFFFLFVNYLFYFSTISNWIKILIKKTETHFLFVFMSKTIVGNLFSHVKIFNKGNFIVWFNVTWFKEKVF